MSKPVVVFGATGFTGRLVVDALMDLGVADVILGGRSAERLGALAEEHGGLDFRVADARQPETLGALVEGAHVVIDTAGPFAEFGEPVVQAAIGARAHFLDTTGEQAYMLNVLQRFHGVARERKVAVVNAQAFEFALGYCCAAMLAECDTTLHTIDVFNRVEGFGTTRGTQKSGLGALAADAWVRKNGQLKSRGLSPLPLEVQFPNSKKTELGVPFPGGEALHLARVHPQVENITTNVVLPRKIARAAMALWSMRPLYRRLHRAGLGRLVERRIDAGPDGPDERSRALQFFKVLARGQGPGGTATVMCEGVDPYGITGTIAAVGAKMLVDGAPLDIGVVSTDQAFGPSAFLDALSPHGVSLVR